MSRWLDLLYPTTCAGCHRPGPLICAECQRTVPALPVPHCPFCLHELNMDGVCERCSSGSNHLDGLRAIGGYVTTDDHEPASPFAEIIVAAKTLHALAEPLGDWLANTLLTAPIPATLVVPLPNHPRRIAERGFDHTLLLAQRVAERLQLPLAESLVYRVRYTRSQSRSKDQGLNRHANVIGAFASRPLPPDTHVLLIDDVYTSGSSMGECAEALRTAGAASVWGAVLGCTVYPH